MKIVVIIPTYNEKRNIDVLIHRLQEVFQTMAHDMNILVVDDNSPDGTADVVKECQKQYRNVFLVQGQKEGLGKAYMRGMRYALECLAPDVIMEMDADFSHKPEDVPRLIEGLGKSDFVIGSRYVKGGSLPKEWTLFRRMNSKWGNIFARYIAGMYSVKDCTAGFRAINASVLKKVNFDTLQGEGYCFQISLLHTALSVGARVKEVPVEFVERLRGNSKLGISDIVEFILFVWMIRLETGKTFIKFGCVGLSGLVINLGSMTILLHLNLNKFVASPISIELSIISNFILNNYWTFANRKNYDTFHLKGLKFNFVSFLSLGMSYGTFIMLSNLLPSLSPQIPQAIGIIPATLVNYFLNSYWTFKDKDR